MTNSPEFLIASGRFWRTGAAVMRWGRSLALAAMGLLGGVVVVYAAPLALFGRASGASVAWAASQAAWMAAVVVPMSIILGRMERVFLGYAKACSR